MEARALSKLAEDHRAPDAFQILHAASRDDIVTAFARRPFSIIQFSGHGEPDGIFVEAEDDQDGAIVDVEEVERILQAARPGLTLALFLSCHSHDMAERLIKSVPILITVKGLADDDACVRFVSSFYEGLLRGDSFDGAYRKATRFINEELETVLLRRAEIDGDVRGLIRSEGGGAPAIYVDISDVRERVRQIGLDEQEFRRMIAHKIRYHLYAFRYPRGNALFPVGSVIGRFAWENAEDYVKCYEIYKFKPDCPDEVCSVWTEMLTMYHDRYVEDYRSPNWLNSHRAREQVEAGLIKLTRYIEHYAGKDGPLERIRGMIDVDLKAPLAVLNANIRLAETNFKQEDTGGTIQKMETALSALHDLLDEIGKNILE